VNAQKRRFLLGAFAVLTTPHILAAAEFQAGVARIDITPHKPIWFAGYDERTHPSTGMVHPLWSKALAIQDTKGSRLVIVTTDLIGLPRAITDLVAARAQQEYGLTRASLLFNSSHTHTGPLLNPRSRPLYNLSDDELRVIDDYSRELAENLFTVVGSALSRLAPAQMSYGLGQAHFALNRREPTPQGIIIGVNPAGPVDPDVPVIRVASTDGTLLAVLFGYACHNTTLTETFYQASGDYAGFAQIELERAHPGATAMFLQLCAGDQNPNPRGTLALAEQHGRTLAREVERVLGTTLAPVKSPLRSTFQNIELAFAMRPRSYFEQEAKSADAGLARRAKIMLKAYDDRHPIQQMQYPIQVVRLNNSLTILALGGEPVVDYGLRVKREYGGSLIVAGYSNEVAGYIPTAKVLKEGGYEVVDSMVGYGQPGPFADDVEDRVMAGIQRAMKAVGLKPRN